MRDKSRGKLDIYGGADPRDVGAYPIADAARYLRVPRSTLRSWLIGQTAARRRLSPPLFSSTASRSGLLSFKDLVQAHIICGLRVHHHVPLQRVRKAVDYVCKTMKYPQPLLDAEFSTDGVDIFVEQYCEGMVNVSQAGQMAIRPLLDAYLQRIEHDKHGVARLFPFVRRREGGVADALMIEPRLVVMDPLVAFGRPTVSGTNIRTSVIAERYLAGESIATLAEDYHLQHEAIEEAIRCESVAA